MREPADIVETPFSAQEKSKGLISPKLGFIFTPFKNTVLRAAYTRSLAGPDEGASVRLEPTEVAGFNQTFRSVIPGSLVSDTSGSTLDTYDISLEQKFDTGTYLAVSAEMLSSKIDDLAGGYVFNFDQTITNNNPVAPLGINQTLNYREKSLIVTADQLLGKQLEAGVKYELTDARLDLSYPGFNPINVTPDSLPVRQDLNSLLDTLNLHVNWNHPSGLFASLDANWYRQHNSGFSPAEPGEDFWQVDAYAGCRFWHRRAEFTIGVLNLTDKNYNFEPLNFYNELPRGRTLLAKLLVTF